MNFPTKALLVLLKFARKEIDFDTSVVEAGLEVLRYCWDIFTRSATYVESGSKEDIEECLVQALDEGSSEVSKFSPTIWVTIGLWVLEKVLNKLSK